MRMRKTIKRMDPFNHISDTDDTLAYFVILHKDKEKFPEEIHKNHGISVKELTTWGIPVPKDFDPESENATDVYLKAAEAGSPAAQYEVGIRYLFGNHVPKDEEKANNWITKSVKQQYPPAVEFYDKYNIDFKDIPKDPQAAAAWLEHKAKVGNHLAQHHLAGLYYRGEGVPVDPIKGFYWYKKAADAGYAPAQAIVGMHYEFGKEPAKQDMKKAIAYYRDSAEKGDPLAQFQLGSAYQQGKGVPVDLPKAVEWCEKAAMQGNMLAECNFGLMLLQGIGVKEDEEKGLVFLSRAAGKGDKLALAYIRKDQAAIDALMEK